MLTNQQRSMVLVCVMGVAALVQGQSISGRVTDAISGKPVPTAKVVVTELKQSYAVDSTGFYAIDSIGAGTFTLRAEAESHLSQTRSIKLVTKKQLGVEHLKVNISLYNIASNADASKGYSTVKYFFPGHNVVEITISTPEGKVVKKVFDRTRIGGARVYAWDGKDNDGQPVPSGIYECKLVSGNLVMMRKLVWKAEK